MKISCTYGRGTLGEIELIFVRITSRQVLFPEGNQPSLYLQIPQAQCRVVRRHQTHPFRMLDTCPVVLRSLTHLNIASSGVTIFSSSSNGSLHLRRQRKLITRKGKFFSPLLYRKVSQFPRPICSAVSIRVRRRATALKGTSEPRDWLFYAFFSRFYKRDSCVDFMKSCQCVFTKKESLFLIEFSMNDHAGYKYITDECFYGNEFRTFLQLFGSIFKSIYCLFKHVKIPKLNA